jgi:tetratricopeptide (TPR) repeat protein
MMALATLEEQAGDYDAAIAHYKRILELQSTNVVALNNLAYALGVHRQQPAEALPIARRAAALAPRAGTVLDTLGWIEHLVGNDVAAARLLAQAIALEPRLAEVQVHAAIVFAAVGQRDRAVAALNQALRLDPGLDQREDVRRLKDQLKQ